MGQKSWPRMEFWNVHSAIDVIHVGISKATRDYTACSPAKRLHAPNTDVLSGVAGYPGPAATLRESVPALSRFLTLWAD